MASDLGPSGNYVQTITPVMALEPLPPVLLPVREFADVWEKEARWLIGPRVVRDVVEYIRFNEYETATRPGDPSAVDLVFPFPGDATFPEPLRPIYWACCGEIAEYRRPALERVAAAFCDGPYKRNDALGHDELRAAANDIERHARAWGWPELWQIAEAVFGLPKGL